MEKKKVYVRTNREIRIEDYSKGVLQVCRIFPEGQPNLISGIVEEQELYVFTKEELERLLRYAFNEGDSAEPGIAGWLQRAEDIFIESLAIK